MAGDINRYQCFLIEINATDKEGTAINIRSARFSDSNWP